MKNPNRGENDGALPLFGNWRNAYLAVVALFVIDVAIFYFFERIFS